jgi:hypothetical protein
MIKEKNNNRNKQSYLYDQISISVLNLNTQDADDFIGRLNVNESELVNYKKLFNAMRKGSSYKDCQDSFENTKLNLRQWLDQLQEKLIDFAENKNRKSIFALINRAEAAFKIGLEVQGVQLLDKLETLLRPEDFWISWRIYELKFVYYDLVKRNNIKTPDSLYYLINAIMKSGKQNEHDFYEISRQSEFVSFLETNRRSSFEEIEKFKDLAKRIESLKMRVYSIENHNEAINPLEFFNQEINQLELFKLMDESIAIIFFAIKNRLFDTHKTLLHGSIQIVNELKSLVSNADCYGPMAWPNLLSIFFVQKQSELNTCMSALNNVNRLKLEHESEISELSSIKNISYRIHITSVIGKIFALEYGYGSTEKFESVLLYLHNDVTNLLNPKSKLGLSEYLINCLKTIKVLLADISGTNTLKTAGSYGTAKRELLIVDEFKHYVSLKQQDLNFDTCSNFLEFAIVKLYKMAWQRKNSKRDFIRDGFNEEN